MESTVSSTTNAHQYLPMKSTTSTDSTTISKGLFIYYVKYKEGQKGKDKMFPCEEKCNHFAFSFPKIYLIFKSQTSSINVLQLHKKSYDSKNKCIFSRNSISWNWVLPRTSSYSSLQENCP